MKAREVLRRYSAEERDFRGLDLRGQSFRGNDLSGADFSQCDIRSADFTEATLTKAKFEGAEAGLERRWAMGGLLVSWLLAALSVLPLSFFFRISRPGTFEEFVARFTESNDSQAFIGLIIILLGLIIISLFSKIDNVVLYFFYFFLLLYAGENSLIIKNNLRYVPNALRAFMSLFACLILSGIGLIIDEKLKNEGMDHLSGIGKLIGLFIIPSMFLDTLIHNFTSVSFNAFILSALPIRIGLFAVNLTRAGTIIGAIGFVIPVIIAVTTALVVTRNNFVAGCVVVTILLFLGFKAWYSFKGRKKKQSLIWRLAFYFPGSTSFYKADLTDADFTRAILKHAVFNQAKITRTCWNQVVDLDLAVAGNTILKQASVRDLLVGGSGYKKSYRLANLRESNLRGANLRGADLEGAELEGADLRSVDFKGANLESASFEGSNLESADLRESNLKRAKLSKANLNKANLYGVNLEDASFEGVNLQSADLRESNLKWAKLSKANLYGANLYGANLYKASFEGANLSKVDLGEANLEGTNFSNADLSWANLKAAQLNNSEDEYYRTSIDDKWRLVWKVVTQGWKNLIGADLSRANSQEVNLVDANLSGANLEEADLSQAILSKADLREINLGKATLIGANLVETNLSQANLQKANLLKANLSRANLRMANLSQADLMQGKLAEARLFRTNMSGVNLRATDLRDADLAEANLTAANLENTNLKWTNLKGATLRGANLTKTDFRGADLSQANPRNVRVWEANFEGATLTGACIEDWEIDSKTNLGGAICDYVYLRENQRQRYPRHGNFAPGESTERFGKPLETFDLVFTDNPNWQAILAAFQQLRERGGQEISIQAIENPDDDGGALVIRASAPAGTNRAELENSFHEYYQLALGEVREEDSQLSPDERSDEREEIYRQQRQQIEYLQELTKQFANQPIKIENIVGNNSVSKGNVNITSGRGSSFSGIVAAGESVNPTNSTIGEIYGTVSQTLSQLPNSQSAEPSIKELLQQLTDAIAFSSDLDEKLKNKALKKVSGLANAATNPTNENMKESAEDAIMILENIVEKLPPSGPLGTTCNSLLPAIAQRRRRRSPISWDWDNN